MYTKMNAQQATRARRGHAGVGLAGAADNSQGGVGCTSSNGVAAAQGAAEVDSPVAMKQCPVCNARCFSDMSVCYNCLHSFGSSEHQTAPQIGKQPVFDAASCGGDPNGTVPGWREEDETVVDDRGLALFGEDVCIPLLEEESAVGTSFVGAATVPSGKPFGITVNVPEGIPASCACGESKSIRPDQLMEVIISIKVAQDACSKQGVATEG